jgi:hypothetical protein
MASFRVVRCRSLAPRLRSSSVNRSLTTDFDSSIRRAASLIEPLSATATKAATDSSFSLVRFSRTLGKAFAVYQERSATGDN